VCPERIVAEAIRALRSAHPYEEPAYDVYPLKAEPSSRGAGRYGIYRPTAAERGRPGSVTLSELLEDVKSKPNVRHLSYFGDAGRAVSRVAICCGSGGELLSAAIAAQCDAFLTGEATFHTSLAARSAGMTLILAGHYATERPAMEQLAAILA